MFKNRQSTALLTITLFTLLWSCTSGAMNEQLPNETTGSIEKNEKNEKNKVIKPFATDQEAKEEYLRLWEKEEALTKIGPPEQGNFSFKKTENEIAWEAYYEELQLFYQRLFRSIVKKDIENKEPYTVILGLKVKDDGSLTMERLPITFGQRDGHNTLLFTLSLYPNNKQCLNLLKLLNKPNDDPAKSADQFFPKIFLASANQIENGLDGEYKEEYNVIFIPKHTFSLVCCTNILHEFAHARQRCQVGGKAYVLNKIFSTFPYSIALELDAEDESIKHHPCPEHLLTLIEKFYQKERLHGEAYKKSKMSFPYYTFSEKYWATCTHHKLTGDPILLPEAKEVHQKLTKKFEHIINMCLNPNEIVKKKYPSCLLLTKESCALAQLFKLRTDSIREKLLQTEKSSNKIEAIENAPNPITGCEKYFEIKCKALGIGQEDKKLENKIENSKNNILEK